ncbi:hypothetical protein PHLGIDRAFT_65373 [Phlebiopsis gigantea 11061_1 CR5-6]|uniref:Arrestin-like N-terminal domain-containing protein n=1 Tax=Phlebiopsis gigantea (strain 11061_1 CR5-6) TaxID=745531 RepID=A0A0C3PT16_PHLG1|nr:hypothetical protein PHLGIDRAFT_65373 [Phlebiopsis gigantea 11061_1 CR5-6]
MVVINPPAIELVFDRRVRVAGETIEGEVHLYFPGMVADNISEVVVKLCGGITTTVTQFQGRGTYVRKHADLTYEERLLWKTGDAFPKASSPTLRLPFQFKLPDVLPSSCDFPCFLSGMQARGTVGYFIEVTGARLGLHRSRKISHAFPVVPWNTAGAASHAHLTVYGWSGRWKTLQQTKDIRKGFRGERSRVEVSVRVPDISGLPVDTPVPFTIDVVTTTKTMNKADLASRESIWPAPPSRVEDLEFTLERTCAVRPGPGHAGEVAIEKKDRVWLPSAEQKNARSTMGQWRQEVTFRSVFNLSYVPPSFETESFSLRVCGHICAPTWILLISPLIVQWAPETMFPWDGEQG